MGILPQIRRTIQEEVLPQVRKKWRPMFQLGMNVLSFCAFRSLNENARLAEKSREAAMMQMYRLVRHDGVENVFHLLLPQLVCITNESVVAMDFSKVGRFYVLCLAVQTGDGRAIPVWVDAIEYPVEEDSQNLFILKVVKEFLKAVGCHPKFVCDRGFIGKTLIHGFLEAQVFFYVRMKQGKTMLRQGKRRVLKKIWELDYRGRMYDRELRVVRSSKTLQKKLEAKECWYIITNDTVASREQVLDWYDHRFEIEETFKDVKHLFDTLPSYITRIQTMKMLLWFQLLGFWLMGRLKATRYVLAKRVKQHEKKLLSWVKYLFEAIKKERTRPLFPCSSFRKVVSVA